MSAKKETSRRRACSFDAERAIKDAISDMDTLKRGADWLAYLAQHVHGGHWIVGIDHETGLIVIRRAEREFRKPIKREDLRQAV